MCLLCRVLCWYLKYLHNVCIDYRIKQWTGLVSYRGGLEALLTFRCLLSLVSNQYFGQWKVCEKSLNLKSPWYWLLCTAPGRPALRSPQQRYLPAWWCQTKTSVCFIGRHIPRILFWCPIEHIWDVLDQADRRRHPLPVNNDQLRISFQEVWKNIHQMTIDKSVMPMRRRCVEANEVLTGFWFCVLDIAIPTAP